MYFEYTASSTFKYLTCNPFTLCLSGGFLYSDPYCWAFNSPSSFSMKKVFNVLWEGIYLPSTIVNPLEFCPSSSSSSFKKMLFLLCAFFQKDVGTEACPIQMRLVCVTLGHLLFESRSFMLTGKHCSK